MKNIGLTVLLIIATASMVCAQGVKPLSQIGQVEEEAIALIKGQWVINGSNYVLEYTDRFAVRIDGLKYYHYKRLNTNPRFPHVYTIVRSEKTGFLYFARGSYENGRLVGTTSKIGFKGNNRLLIFSSKNPKRIYQKATRVKKQTTKKPNTKK